MSKKNVFEDAGVSGNGKPEGASLSYFVPLFVCVVYKSSFV